MFSSFSQSINVICLMVAILEEEQQDEEKNYL